jgi:thiol-disulfide isomerase/thioredoxin
MDCPTCIPVLEKEVLKLSGVIDVRGNYITRTIKVTYNPLNVKLEEIETAIERIGYQIAYKKYPNPFSRLKGFFKRKKEEKIKSLSDADFSRKVLNESKVVSVLFSSPTCPTCNLFKPEYLRLVERVGEKAEFYEMDISSTQTWRDYDILSIPTVLIFREGTVISRFTALPKTGEIEEALIV